MNLEGITNQRTLVIIAVVVVVALLFVGMIFYFRSRTDKRQQREIRHEEFEAKRDLLNNSALESELAKLRLSEKGRVLNEKFIEWKNKYEETLEVLKVDISNNISTHEEYLVENKLKQADEIAPSITLGLEQVSTEFEMIENDLKSYVDEDTKVRQRIEELNIENNEVVSAHGKLSLPTELNDEIVAHFDEVASLNEQVLIHLDESEYELANTLLKSESSTLKEVEKKISTYPKFLTILDQTIVTSLEDLDKKYRVMKGDYFFEEVDVQKKQIEFNNRYNDLISILRNMNLKQLDVSAAELSAEVNALNEFLSKEEKNRENVNKFIPELKKLVSEANVRVKAIGEEWRLLQAYYDEDAFKGKSIVRLEERAAETNAHFATIEMHHRSNTQSFSAQRSAIEVFVRDLHALNQHLGEFEEIIMRLRKDETDAKIDLTNLEQLYRHTIRKVKQAKMPQMPAEFDESNKMSKHLLDVLKGEIETLPVNVDRLHDALEKCENEVVSFYEDASKMVKTFNLSQRALVFANRYRNESPNIDSELVRSEFSFLSGYYGKSLEMTLGIIAIKDERMHEKLVNYYEEKIIDSNEVSDEE